MADVQIAVIDTTENVVNVAVPGVQGPIGLTGSVTIAQAGTAATPGIRFESDTNTGIYSPGADQLAVATNGIGRLFVDASGRVGVGTASPSTVFEAAFTAGIGTPRIRLDQTSANPYVELQRFSGAASEYVGTRIRSSDNTAGLVFERASSAALGSQTFVESARVTSTGLVGIGTSSPAAILHVKEGTNKNIFIGAATGSFARISAANDANNALVELDVQGSQVLFTTGAFERARIDSSGRLLVGTSSDSGGALLQVNGDRIRVGTAKTPATSGATGAAGEIAWDADYIYVCTAANTWKRVAIATW